MTQCSAGSRPQAAAPAYFWFTWQAFSAFVSSKLGRLGSILWAFFADNPFDVSVFCATEPDIRTPPTLLQWLGFFALDPVSRQYVNDYLLDCFKSFLWPSYCECIPSGGTYTCATLVTHPKTYANSVSVSDGEWGVEFVPSADGYVYGGWQRVGAVGTGQYKHCVYGPGVGGVGFYCENMTPTTSDAKYFFATPIPVVSGSTYKYTGKFPSGSGWQLKDDGVNVTPVDTAFAHFNYMVGRTGTDPFTTQSPFTFPPDPLFCPNIDTYYPVPPDDPTDIPDHPDPSCSTTADLCARLLSIQSTLLQNFTETNWLQSALAPTCWVPGTASTGLTGAGTIDVADIVGAYVTFTIPSHWGRTTETPPRSIPKVGELQWGIDGVIASEHQLHYEAEQILGAPISTNSIVYNLREGITADITPLQRCK